MVASTRIFQGNELNKQINSIDHSPDADDIRRVLRQYTQHDPDSGFFGVRSDNPGRCFRFAFMVWPPASIQSDRDNRPVHPPCFRLEKGT